MVGPPESQLTLRAQDGGHRDLGVSPGRCGVPSAETLLSGPWVSVAPCPSGLSTPGTIREEDTWCWNREGGRAP